jgi:putative transposase
MFAPGEFYHIYNRGNSKQRIFKDTHDYDHFIKLLFLSNSKNNFVFRNIKNPYSIDRGSSLVEVGAYTTMPNHFHLLLKERGENGITRYLHKLSTSYSKYYNARHRRTGKLFEGEFKAEHITDDKYLKYLFSYIHLNPLKLIEPKWRETKIDQKKGLRFLRNYEYSSYRDFTGEKRNEGLILNLETFPSYFPNSGSFEGEILEWINFNSD